MAKWRASARASLAFSAWLALAGAAAGPLTAQEEVAHGNEGSGVDSLEAAPPAVPTSQLGRDSVLAAPGVSYPAGPLHRFLLGDLNRRLWEIRFWVPVLDLDSVGGGLEVEELAGGRQTAGLRFESRDGRTFQFRSMVKSAGRSIPQPLRSTPIGDIAQDQMAALFPLSAMVVAELVEAAGLLVAKPRPVVLPDDPRLGRWREEFAGRMGWIEERPDEGEEEGPGFAGSARIAATEELFEALEEDPRSYVDQRKVLRARLIDMLVGDWDRHEDQWRWAAFPDGERTRWDPIPRDRDWALARIDGLLPGLASLYYPEYVGFEDEPPDPYHLAWASQGIDRRLLTALSREEFLAIGRDLRVRISDDVIGRAVGVLPAPHLEVVGEDLVAALRTRRDALEELALEFYDLLSRWVDVRGTREEDSVTITSFAPDSLRVEMRAPEEGGLLTYARTFQAEETREVRIYLFEGDDRVLVGGSPAGLPLDVRVVGGEGDDRYVDRTAGERLHVYDRSGSDGLVLGPEAYVSRSPFAGQEEPAVADMAWDTRDWGSVWVPRPALRYDPDIGVYLGAGLTRYGFGFGYAPWRSRYSASLLNGFGLDQWIGDVEFERPFGDRGWRAGLSFDWYTRRPSWLFGLGNETPRAEEEIFHRSHRNQARLGLQVAFAPDSSWEVSAGPTAAFAGAVDRPGTVFDSLSLYGTGAFKQVGLRAGAWRDTRDSRDLPTSGAVLAATGKVFPAVWDVEEPFGGLRAEARAYLSSDLPGQPAVHLRLVGERVWGRTPYHELPYLGGSETLPGYRERRFLGETVLSASALVRLKLARARVFTDAELGVHAVGTIGRVWLADEASDRWHPGVGGGAWMHLLSAERTLSITYVRGRGEGALYLGLGFLF